MADDTRLAEACLLLNYSNQSYRDMMLNEQLQKNPLPSTDDTSRSICNRVDIKQEPINSVVTPPPSEEQQCSTSLPENNPTSRECFANYFDSEELNDSYVELTSKEDDNYDLSKRDADEFCSNYSYIDREPINNLLAAVNCALPSHKTRPTILQRPIGSNHNQAPSTNKMFTYPPSILPDHNYCLNQYQSTAAFSNTEQPQAVVINKSTAQNISSTSSIAHRSEVPVRPRPNQTKPARRQKHSSGPGTSKLNKPLKLVAIHLGAGNSYNGTESLQLAKSICEEVMLKSPSLANSHSKKKRKNVFIGQDNPAQASECLANTHNLNESQLNAETAVVQLIKLMEDNQALNCGFGSNLNIKGQVECDASLMSDKNQVWAGIGAVSGCKNPILLAKSLFDHRSVPRPLGLIQPNMLVGSGAKQWMREHCPQLSIVDSKLVSTRAFSTYQKLKSRYDSAMRSFGQNEKTQYSHSGFDGYSSTGSLPNSIKESPSTSLTSQIVHDEDSNHLNALSTKLDHGFYCLKTSHNLQKSSLFISATDESYDPNTNHKSAKRSTPSCNESIKTQLGHCLDTVGAIAVDFNNNFASAISSGGLLLKYKGRVGQAAIPGAGCWAEDSVAITTTGVGEYLTQTLFARKFYDKMLMLRLLHDLGHVEKRRDLSDLISCAVDECFEDLMKAPALSHVPPQERLAGMLSVSTLNSKDSPNRVDNNDLYLSFAHNCSSMCVAYMTCEDIVGHSLMSRKTDGEKFNVEESDTGNSSTSGAVVRTLRFSLDTNKYTQSQD